jgi:hypothetical protein
MRAARSIGYSEGDNNVAKSAESSLFGPTELHKTWRIDVHRTIVLSWSFHHLLTDVRETAARFIFAAVIIILATNRWISRGMASPKKEIPNK